jgi:peptidoglycan/LPS O-acetylase OafA/YrhL
MNFTPGSDDSAYRPGDYLPALDGLRALSIAAVLLYHDDYLIPGGYLGVDVFFVLSGFLITSLLFKEWRETGRIVFRRFYLRRALRLFPALAALLAVGTAFVLVFPNAPQSPHVLKGVGYSLVYMTNWASIRDPSLFGPLAHIWSLAVEEQFYLLWPILLIVLLRLTRGRWTLIAATFALALASSVWRLFLLSRGSTPWRLYVGTDTRADSLFLGCVAAFVLARPGVASFVNRSPRLRAAALGAAILLFALLRKTSLEWIGYGRGMFLVVAIAAAVIAVVVASSPDWAITSLLSMPLLVWIGRLSYSLYLWHLPIYGLLKAGRFGGGIVAIQVSRIVAAFAVAAASYYLIERPFLRLKRRISTYGAGPAR